MYTRDDWATRDLKSWYILKAGEQTDTISSFCTWFIITSPLMLLDTLTPLLPYSITFCIHLSMKPWPFFLDVGLITVIHSLFVFSSEFSNVSYLRNIWKSAIMQNSSACLLRRFEQWIPKRARSRSFSCWWLIWLALWSWGIIYLYVKKMERKIRWFCWFTRYLPNNCAFQICFRSQLYSNSYTQKIVILK